MTFLQDFQNLYRKQPHVSVHGYQNENCPYGDFIYLSKDSYLSFDSDELRDCLYCDFAERVNTTGDCSYIMDSELCYESSDCKNCYNCNYCQECQRCYDCAMCFDCTGCSNCYGCVGLRNKQFYVFNEQCTQEEFVKKTQDPEAFTKFENLKQKTPRLGERMWQSEGCTGDQLHNCQNCYECYDCTECQDCGYLVKVYPAYHTRSVDTFDVYHSVDLTECYEIINLGDGYNCQFCYYCEHLKDSMYCEGCFNSHHLFGCVYRNHAEYEILNVQYEPEEWEKRVAEIISQMKSDGEWGKWWELS